MNDDFDVRQKRFRREWTLQRIEINQNALLTDLPYYQRIAAETTIRFLQAEIARLDAWLKEHE